MHSFIPFKSVKGSATVIFAAAVLVILASASLAVDIGFTMNEKAKLANAVDAAALAGAQDLPLDSELAKEKALEYLGKNGIDTGNAIVTADQETGTIYVSSSRKVNYFFAGVLGYKQGDISTEAKAKLMPVTKVYSGVRPFAIENTEFEFGREYDLKEGGGSGSDGNYDAISLGGQGASIYWGNIVYGYSQSLGIGAYVDTEPGNMSGPTEMGVTSLVNGCTHSPKCTFDNFQPDCSRVITVVIVDSIDLNGRKTTKIVGFASFFLEGVEGSGNESIVKGRFVKNVVSGDTDEGQNNYGLLGIKLVH